VLWPTGRVADTLGRRAVGGPAYLVCAAIAVTVGLATTVPLFLLVLALYGVGTGLTSVTSPAVVGDVVPPERTGIGVGVLNTAGDLGSVLGPLVSNWLAGVPGYGWGFGASAAAGDQWTRRVADARDPACPGDARRPGHSVHSCVC
jgi:MFS family permease